MVWIGLQLSFFSLQKIKMRIYWRTTNKDQQTIQMVRNHTSVTFNCLDTTKKKDVIQMVKRLAFISRKISRKENKRIQSKSKNKISGTQKESNHRKFLENIDRLHFGICKYSFLQKHGQIQGKSRVHLCELLAGNLLLAQHSMPWPTPFPKVANDLFTNTWRNKFSFQMP